jgi:dUTP pyrophosphatase
MTAPVPQEESRRGLENNILKVKKLRDDAIVPTVSHPGEDLGYDVYALEDTTLYPDVVTKVRTGISAVFNPYNDIETRKYGLLIRDRSSMASKGIMVSSGVIDAGYRGEIVVCITLLGTNIIVTTGMDSTFRTAIPHESYKITKGDKIAQMIPIEVMTQYGAIEVDELPESKRGTNGFGSTGK